jgi:hypothetical protein
MRIYIDEAGGFVVPPPERPHSYSLVLSLSIPSASEPELFFEFLRVRDAWPKQEVEIKGSALDESQAAQIVDLLARYDVLVNFFAIDMATHDKEVVDDYKTRQAEEITAHVTRDHFPDVVQLAHTQSEIVRNMPNQLFLQAILTMWLILDTIEISIPYFAQRQPADLGGIAWIIDRKNRSVTDMEKTWTELILPISESHFARHSLGFPVGPDYSYFHASYGFTNSTMDEAMARHVEWANETIGMRALKDGDHGIYANVCYHRTGASRIP